MTKITTFFKMVKDYSALNEAKEHDKGGAFVLFSLLDNNVIFPFARLSETNFNLSCPWKSVSSESPWARCTLAFAKVSSGSFLMPQRHRWTMLSSPCRVSMSEHQGKIGCEGHTSQLTAQERNISGHIRCCTFRHFSRLHGWSRKKTTRPQ